MASVQDIKRATRAAKIRFKLPDGREIVVPPPTLDQAIECLLLDPAPASPRQELVSLRARVAAKLGAKHVAVRALDLAVTFLRRVPDDDVTDNPESPLHELERLRRQFVILVGAQNAGLTAQLDKWQIGEMVGALYISGCGMNAELFARWQVAQRGLNRKLSALEMIDQLERLSVDLAAELKRLPDEVGAKPLADLVALQETLQKKRRETEKWDAALHDKKIVN